jgi:D-alanine transaminase
MTLPVCWLNGDYLPLSEARVSPLDRAFLFGDAVYEVIFVSRSRAFRLREHLDRLNRSLAGIRMRPPMAHEDWARLCAELVTRNGASDAHIYIQVSRGAELARNHAWPEGLKPTLFAYMTAAVPIAPAALEQGVSAVTAADTRWARRDIKSTALLANVLLKKQAADVGAFEAILLENGELTEGSSTSVHVVKGGRIASPPNGRRILPGTTRDVMSELAVRVGLPTEVRPVTEAELRAADEIWLAFTTRGLLPVSLLDGVKVGSGTAGPLFKRMYRAFEAYLRELDGTPAL